MTEDPRSKLGRGLDALFEDNEPKAPGQAAPGAGAGVARLPVGDLAPGPFQPRETFEDGAMAALIENIQRQDLTPVEEAEGYRRLTEEFDRTQDELSRALGKSRSHIANALRLLHLPDAIKLLLNQGGISAGHGRALLNAPDPVAVAVEVMRRNLTVRETERLIAGEAETKQRRGPRPRTGKSADILDIEHRLSRMLGIRITVTPRGDEAGELTVRYTTLEQFEDVVKRLTEGVWNDGGTVAPPEEG